MSGIRPSTSGNYVNKNSITKNPILNKSVLLPEFFQQNGYYVAGSGKLFHGAHFNLEVQGHGFDEYYPNMKQEACHPLFINDLRDFAPANHSFL